MATRDAQTIFVLPHLAFNLIYLQVKQIENRLLYLIILVGIIVMATRPLTSLHKNHHQLRATFMDLYSPQLVTVLREGYKFSHFKADAFAGLTVAIVALPLSMAIAIASGVAPERGLYTAIIGGLLVSLFGGSRFQIGGPAGAFIVLVSTTLTTQGLDGLILSTMLSGILLLLGGFLRLGTFIKFIPYPVTVGFSAGIAVVVFASQIKDLLGLHLTAPEPAPIIEKLHTLFKALPTFSPTAMMLSLGTIITIAGIRYFRPRWPALLIAVTLAATVVSLMGLPVDTIGTRFGALPQSLPMPHMPTLSLSKIIAAIPAAIIFTVLGSIESLLSALVADNMTGRRHRSNCELVAQGIANIGSALFGGFCVTGTIARTATNVRAGAHGPVAGILHALFLLLFVLLLAPLASFIPLAALAGVLATVAWNMVEKHAISMLVRASRGETVVLVATLLLTIFRDLIEGIVIGFSLSALLVLYRMNRSMAIDNTACSFPIADDQPDTFSEPLYTNDTIKADDPDIMISRISGAFFFGVAATVALTLEQIACKPKAFIIDFSAVPFLDSTGATTLELFLSQIHANGAFIVVTGANPAVRRTLLLHGVHHPIIHFRATIPDGVQHAREHINNT